ncbi:unnamed protein product [Oikopleura dioica]|uniref:Uncharacterized protein n=1 Tax=Oikopleura dioica TaxID=34765 RepID=E4YDJ3_OIKDI|nr:unnamed protein product [Oikopleura dioica]
MGYQWFFEQELRNMPKKEMIGRSGSIERLVKDGPLNLYGPQDHYCLLVFVPLAVVGFGATLWSLQKGLSNMHVIKYSHMRPTFQSACFIGLVGYGFNSWELYRELTPEEFNKRVTNRKELEDKWSKWHQETNHQEVKWDNRGLAVGSVSAAVADRIEADEAKKSS